LNELCFYFGCLVRTPFRQVVPAIAAAGFEAMTLWPNVWRHAQKKDGLSLAAMRALLDEHRIRVTELEGFRDWTPQPAHPGPLGAPLPRSEYFEVGAALGANALQASYWTDAPLLPERETESFARLCDDAAKYAMRVGLEAVAFSGIPSVDVAWPIVQKAGRANAGLIADIAHHVRSGASEAVLASIPAERIYCVQLSDGPRRPPADLAREAMFERLPPGEGEWDVARYLQIFASKGVRCPVGPEHYNASFDARPPTEVARELAQATRDALVRAGLPAPGRV
jgi:sugar phosphate isomerase/epimerase